MFVLFFFFVAEVESEPEEEGKDSNHPRDSGCFESSENLEAGREEGNKEEQLEEQIKEMQVKEGHKEEEQNQQLDAVQQQLEELTLDEGSWVAEGNNGLWTCVAVKI